LHIILLISINIFKLLKSLYTKDFAGFYKKQLPKNPTISDKNKTTKHKSRTIKAKTTPQKTKKRMTRGQPA